MTTQRTEMRAGVPHDTSCLRCWGTGYKTCPSCAGSGKTGSLRVMHSDRPACPECLGLGKVACGR